MNERQRIKAAYDAMNRLWPADMPAPSGPEAVEGVKRLLREAYRYAGKPLPDGLTFKVTSGNRHTWGRWSTWAVNPNYRGRGWRPIVHGVSHWVHARTSPGRRPHQSHLPLERHLIEYALAQGFAAGALARKPRASTSTPKAKPDVKTVRAERVEDSIRRWESKLKRAENALKKLKAKRAYYARTLTAKTVTVGTV